MSTALQCPSCGCKHRLDSIPDAPVFSCAGCGRPLKVPPQYRAGGAAPAAGAAGKGATARRAAPKAARARVPGASGSTRLPLRILAWIVAFVLGAVVVRTLAKWTGFVGGDTVVNLLIDNKLTTYLRLAALVPVWALFATIFATLILEGPGWWAARKAGATVAPGVSRTAPTAKRSRMPATSAAAAGAAAGTKTARKVPTRAPRTNTTPTSTRAQPTRPAAAAAGAAGASAGDPGADEFDSRAAAGQRPRRIPRRDTGS